MKHSLYKIGGTLLSSALTVLGFSSCSSDSPDTPCEYGTPIVKYRVVGQVTDETGAPIPGIKVTLHDHSGLRYRQYLESCGDSAFTDVQGKFATQVIKDYVIGKQTVKFEDVDGDMNGGLFDTDSAKLTDLQSQHVKPGHGDWDQGEFEFSGKMKLHKKK